jgi:hypothetical protein
MGPKKKDKKGDDGDALTRIAIVGADKCVAVCVALCDWLSVVRCHRWERDTVSWAVVYVFLSSARRHRRHVQSGMDVISSSNILRSDALWPCSLSMTHFWVTVLPSCADASRRNAGKSARSRVRW